MGAEFSSHDFTACSPHPAGSRVSFAYAPSNLSGSAPSLKTPPCDRIKSAPATGRTNNLANNNTTAISSPGQPTNPITIPSSASASTTSSAAAAAAAAVSVKPSTRRQPSVTTAASQSVGVTMHNGGAGKTGGGGGGGGSAVPSVSSSSIPAVSTSYSNTDWSTGIASSSDLSDTSDSDTIHHKSYNGLRSVSESPQRFRQGTTSSETASCPQCSCACHGGAARDAVVEALRTELKQAKIELARSKEQVASLKHTESKLRQRLSEQARRQLEKSSTKFEDLNLGDKRPTQLIRRYGNLYTESRLEALDALDDIVEMSEFSDLKGKLLLTILVLSFRNARKNLLSVKVQVRRLLHIPELLGAAQFGRSTLTSADSTAAASTDSRNTLTLVADPAVKELDDVISVYLRKTVDRFDLTRNYEEVCERVWETLFDFPRLRHCSGLLHYIDDCVRLAWALTVQNPPFNINFEHTFFSPDVHTRFHTSDPTSDAIKAVLWPVLIEGDHGPCVYKGVVVT